MSNLELSPAILDVPVPNLDAARTIRKAGYADVALDVTHPLSSDPIVPLSEYGIGSRSYYSRPNITGDPVPGVKPEVLVRRDIAERLAGVNEFLQNADFVASQSGGRVGLFVEEGLRSIGLQGLVYDEIYPSFLRQLHPDWNDEMIAIERDRRVAKPSPASPHASGGAVDVKLVRMDGSGEVSYGYDHAERFTIRPDYFEQNDGPDAYRLTRRIVFHAMTAAGLVNHPEEVWHYGRGDRLSDVLSPAVVGHHIPAYYAAVEGALELE